MKLYKYEFISERAFNTQLNKLKQEVEPQVDEQPYVVFDGVKALIKLGFIQLEPATFDSDGNELTPAVLTDKYCVDIVWHNNVQSENFASYEVSPKNPKHKIYGQD